MRPDNPFDKRLKLYQNRLPSAVVETLTHVCDNLEWSLVIAVSVFEKKATPEHALEICKMLEARQTSKARRRKRTED